MTALSPAQGQVLIRNVRKVDPLDAQAHNPDVELRAGVVRAIGPNFTPPVQYEFGEGDTVYFVETAPLIRWPDGLAQIGIVSVIAWASGEV